MIGDDIKMYCMVDELFEMVSIDMFYKCVLIYDDCNLVYIFVLEEEVKKFKK